MTSPAALCVSCDTPVSGRFCPQCGADTSNRTCRICQATLSPGAQFCHRCATATKGSGSGLGVGRQRVAWAVAAAAVLIAVATVAYVVGRGNLPAPQAPAMANAGNASGRLGLDGGRPSVPAPDISNLSPRERFDRLFDRVIRAAEAQSADTVLMFAPMALGAYDLLDEVDADARYHAAMIQLVVGEFAGAKAKADTILANRPTHLFGFLIQGEVAEQEKNGPVLAQAYASFLAAYDAEMAAGLPEYGEHRPVLADFRNRSQASKP